MSEAGKKVEMYVLEDYRAHKWHICDILERNISRSKKEMADFPCIAYHVGTIYTTDNSLITTYMLSKVFSAIVLPMQTLRDP